MSNNKKYTKYDIDNLLREALKSDEEPDISLIQSVGTALRGRPENFASALSQTDAEADSEFDGEIALYKKSRRSDISKNIKRYLGTAVSVAVIVLFVGGIGLAAWFLNLYTPSLNAGDSNETFILDNNEEINNNAGTPPVNNIDNSSNEINSGCYTFLILGVDKSGGPTDTIMVAVFNVKENTISVLNIPRDLYVSTKDYTGRINGVYAKAGIEYLKAVIEYTFGINIQRHIILNLEGFKTLVDKIGGVDFDVPMRMKYTDPYQKLYIDLNKGVQHLDGDKAEQLIRFRHGDSGYPNYYDIGYPGEDIGRIETQKRFMSALMKKILANIDANTIKGLSEFGSDYITSNISNVDTGWFAAKMINVKLENIRTHTVPGAWISSILRYEAYKAETIEIINKYYNPNEEDIPESKFNIYDKDLSALNGYKPEIDIDGKTMDNLVN